MKKILRKIIAIAICVVMLTGSIPVNAAKMPAATVSAAGISGLIITEAYIDDINRPEWIPAGVSTFDPMEYVEVYNPGSSPVNFSQNYDLYHYRNTGATEYKLPLYNQTEEVVIPAHSSIVLWGFWADNYKSAPADKIPTVSDFKSAFGIEENVGVYQVNTTSCKGFYNTYNASFRLKDKSGTLVSEAAYTPATDTADGKSVEFRMPPEGTSMLVYRQKVNPTPGSVSEEQYYIPPQEETANLIITEAYIDDIDRPEWVPSGSAFDPMEYVEIYNPGDSAVNFSEDYGLYHFRNSANKEYSLPLYNQTEAVIIPAHESVVLWGFLASRYSGASPEQTPTVDDFKRAFGIGDSVKVYMVDTTSAVGFYNTYNANFRIKDKNGVLICEAAYTPATDTADGKSVEFRMPPEGTSMLVYGQKVNPTPGSVSEEQYTPPPIPNKPVINSIDAKDNYARGESFTVSANISDAKNASLFIKQSEETGYRQVPMETQGNGAFSLNIPRAKLWGETLKWYIEAYNDTKSTKSEERTANVLYSYDPQRQPQVLMTELKTEDTDYNYLEFYNNSDHVINFAYYSVFYEYPSGLSYLRWTFDVNALYIDPGKTLVVWINDDDKTVAQFNQHYGVNLVQNKSIIKVNYSGMSPDVERTIKLGNTYENPILVATYHEDPLDDTAKTTSIHYTFSRDNGTRMIKADITSAPTPGTVKDWQIPSERVPFDNYGGADDENTMVLRPREAMPETIEEGEALNVAFDCYDTATGINTIETYYKFDDEAEYRVKMEKTQRIAGQFITSVPASEFLGHKKVNFYIRAYNAFRYYDTQVYTVSIKPSINDEGITLNVKDNQILSNMADIIAGAGSGSEDISIQIDGQEQQIQPMLENGAYFSYKAGNLTSYYKNAITVGNNVIKLLSSWANVNQKGAHIDSSLFTGKANGDYEVTVTVRAGTEGSPFEATGTRASFNISNMALYLPDGTFIYSDNGIVYENQYTIGDSTSNIALAVHFTIPKDQLKAKGMTLDTTTLSEGEHVVRASANTSSQNAVITVDNAAPEIDPGIGDGQELKSGEVILPQANDRASGIDNTKTKITVDGKEIQLPFTVNSSNLKSGPHTLYVSYTDIAGHTAEKSVSFTADIAVPNAQIDNVKQTDGTKGTMSVKIYGENDEAVNVEFLEGKHFSTGENNIQVSSGAGDDPLLDRGSDSLHSAKDTELPYQLFQVETGNLEDEAFVEADWKGTSNANGPLKMFVLNVAKNEWESAGVAEQGQIKASFKAKDHVKDGKAMLLVQNRSQSSYPSAKSTGTPRNGTSGNNGGSYVWDGTGVPENYDFSFAWITDPQYYTESWPDHYMNQNQWILDNRDKYNIKYTINTGDLIDEWDRDEQWKIADEAQRLLDDGGMPNGVLAGNHDVASGNEEYDSYWKYFGEQRYKDNSYYGGSYRNNLGHYDLISAGGQDFIILYMSWDVYQPEVDWMNEVLSKYPDRKAIIAMHRYLKQGGTLDYAGELVQKEVVAKNKNVFAVINGHYFGAAIKVDGFDDNGDGIKERKVYQICTDYQGAVQGGLQYFKMMYFDLKNNKIYMNAYSPYLNDFNYFDNPKLASYDIGVTATSQDIYELDVQFDTNLKTLETEYLNVDVYTDRIIGKQENVTGQAIQIWDGLTPDTRYWWYADITNAKGDTFRTPLSGIHTPGGDELPLRAPDITSVISGDGHAVINWEPVEGAEGYRIFSGTTPGAIDVAAGTADSSVHSYDASGLTNGTAYYFVIRAIAEGDESGNSEEVAAVPQALEPGAPEILSAEAGDGHVRISWKPVEGATGYNIYSSTTPAAISIPAGTAQAEANDYDVPDLTNGIRYYFAVTAIKPEGESARSNQASAMPRNVLTVPGAPEDVTAVAGDGKAIVSFKPPKDDGGSPITGYIVTSVPGGITAAGTDTAITVTGLSNGTTYTFTVKAVNSVGNSPESKASNEVTPRRTSSQNGSGNNSTSGEPEVPVKTGLDILINGRSEAIAEAVTAKVNDKTVTTITVDDKKVEEKIKEEGSNATVTIPFNGGSDVTVIQLNGQTVKNMETLQTVLEIKVGNVIYTLPAAQINIDNVSSQMGAQTEAGGITVSIKLSAATEETAGIVADTADKNNYKVMINPVEFEITCTAGDETVEVSRFNSYMERMVAVPEGTDPQSITTGVVLNPDGTFSHVPTEVTVIDGRYYAKINSLTNSTYLVIGNSRIYGDVEKHWAKEAVNDMGSRLIFDGTANGDFEPDRSITRAEFAVAVVKALGLMRPGTGRDTFSDVAKGQWYYDAVTTAGEYGIISGYGNGKFGPMDTITREQAMVMIKKAMKITGLKVEFNQGEMDELLASFSDSGLSADWAREGVVECVKAGIISGKGNKLLAPLDKITRAEAAVILQKLLQKSDLI